MTTIDLSQPGRRYVHARGKHYVVYGHQCGLEIERVSDKASVFMQGDDALSLENDLDACRTVRSIDTVCDAYDLVMERN